MGKAPNPFSLYDFLGYFFPGAVAIYSVVIAYGHVSDKHRAVTALKDLFSPTQPENVLPFVLAAYVTGHFLSFLSSITVEKYLYWNHGFPSQFLFGAQHKVEWPKQLALWPLGIANLFVVLPIAFCDLIVGHWFGLSKFYAKPLDEPTREVIQRNAGAIVRSHGGFAEPGDAGKHFHFLYHYALEHAPQHGPKLQNYVALYGFLRTATLIALIFFWIAVWHVFYSRISLGTAILILFPIGVAAYLFFLAYLKFLRRYSVEIFMAATVANKTSTNT